MTAITFEWVINIGTMAHCFIMVLAFWWFQRIGKNFIAKRLDRLEKLTIKHGHNDNPG